METMEQLIEARKYVTTRSEYDRLSLQIAEAGTLRDLEENKKRAQIAETQRAEMLAKKKYFKEKQAEVDQTFKALGELDNLIFKDVESLVTHAEERLSKSEDVFDVENSLISMAAELHLPPVKFHEPKLFGGAPVARHINTFLKIWLQRYIDRLDRDGKVTPEVIAEHGIEGGQELDDHPSKF